MTTQQMLDERYGRATPLRRRVGLGIAIALGALLAIMVGTFVVMGTIDDVDADASGFAVVDEHTVTVRYQVTTEPGRDVVCALEAQDTQHGVVGWRVVELPAGDSPTREFEHTIPTTAEATTGFVNACWVS
jgi:hypothetical protein